MVQCGIVIITLQTSLSKLQGWPVTVNIKAKEKFIIRNSFFLDWGIVYISQLELDEKIKCVSYSQLRRVKSVAQGK